MKRMLAPVLIVVALFCLMSTASGEGVGELVLLDHPKGTWLATVRGDTALAVLEERDGWRRVRLEGWTMAAPGPATAPGPAAAPVPAAAPGPSAAPAPETSALHEGASGGARIQGVLAPDIRARGTAGAGVLVLLVPDSEGLDAEHRRAGEECEGRVGALNRQIETLGTELQGALNSSDNFREAATRNDQIKARLKNAERERLLAIQDCRGRAEAIFQRHAVARSISDGDGRFGFEGVVPGRYRVVAFETTGDRPRSWSLGCVIEGTGTRVLDPRADRTASEADWGMR